MDLRDRLTFLQPDLVREIELTSKIENIPAGQEILREGQYVKVIPIVLDGLLRVFIRYSDKELLLYYIKAGESCVMSFTAGIQNEKSKIHAVTEMDSEVLLLPVSKFPEWLTNYRSLNDLFYYQYNTRYMDMVDTIGKVIFTKLDERLMEHLHDLAAIRNTDTIKISHQQLANELGTAREVVSRILKKLEKEGLVNSTAEGIKIL